MRNAWFAVALFSPWVASAGEPQISVSSDGTIVARMLIDAPSQQVVATIPELQDASLSKSVFEMKKVPDGKCSSIFRKTRGLWSPLEMNTRICPTAKGWREYLVSSEDYDAYDVEWIVQPTDGGSDVMLSVRSEINLAVPTSLVQSGIISDVNLTFKHLLGKLFQGKQSAP